MRKVIAMLIGCIMLSSCTTVSLPFTVQTPALPELDESFSDENILTEMESVEDIVHNLLVYEGQVVYYRNISDVLMDYIEELQTLSLTVEEKS